MRQLQPGLARIRVARIARCAVAAIVLVLMYAVECYGRALTRSPALTAGDQPGLHLDSSLSPAGWNAVY